MAGTAQIPPNTPPEGEPARPRRIVFLDLMRFVALVMMIQGHTIYALIDREHYLTDAYPGFQFWEMIRGYTAPVFMMVAGTVFVYLLLQQSGTRVRKGLKRAALLVFLGYFLHFSVMGIFFGSDPAYTAELLARATKVDVLHLIGMGLFGLILAYRLANGNAQRLQLYLLMGALLVLAAYPWARHTDFSHWPRFFAAWMNRDTGSLFPFFPWLAYLFAGGMLGVWIAGMARRDQLASAWWRLLTLAGLMLGAAVVGDLVETAILGKSWYYDGSPNFILHRMGIVVLITGVIATLSRNARQVPYVIRALSKNTLWIYIAHLEVIYRVFRPIFGKKLPLEQVAGLLVLQYGLMILLALGIEYGRKWWRNRKRTMAEVPS